MRLSEKNKSFQVLGLVKNHVNPDPLRRVFYQPKRGQMLITRRISFLQAIQKAAFNGYVHYTTGRVSVEKFPAFVKKINEQYQPNLTSQQNYRRKLKGLARAKFYCYPDEQDPSGLMIFFVIMITKGQHPAFELEQLQDLRLKKSRLIYSDYELIQKPSRDKQLHFTFKLTTEAYSYYLEKLRHAVRSKRQSAIALAIKHISNLSGFSGVRQQKKRLNRHYQGELKRSFNQEQYVTTDWPKLINLYARQFKVEQVKNVRLFCRKVIQTQRSALQVIADYHKNKAKIGSGNNGITISSENLLNADLPQPEMQTSTQINELLKSLLRGKFK